MTLSFPLECFLAQMEYPATKDDLLREAARDGLDEHDVHLIERLDGHSYGARWQILSALRAIADRALAAA